MKKFLLIILIITINNILAQSVNKLFSQKSDFHRLEYQYYLFEGFKNKYLQNYRSSVSAFQNALIYNDTSVSANYEMANLLMMAQNYSTALNYSLKALQLDSLNKWIYLQYAQILFLKKEYQACINFLKQTQKKFPLETIFYNQLSELYRYTKNFDSAIFIIKSAQNYYTSPFQLYNQYIVTFSELNNHDSVLFYLKSYLNTNPNPSESYNLFNIYWEICGDTIFSDINFVNLVNSDTLNPFYLFSKLYLAAIKNNKDDILNYSENFFYNTDISFNQKLKIYELISKDTNFIYHNKNFFEKILFAYSNFSDDIMPKTLYVDFLIKTKSYLNAIGPLKNIINYTTPNSFFYQQLINLYFITKNIDSAFIISKNALKFFPSDPNLYLLAGISAYRLNKYDSAEYFFKEGIKFVSYSSYNLLNDYFAYLGNVYYYKKDYNNAFNYFEQALKIDSTDLITLNNYAYFLACQNKNLEKAFKMSNYTILKDSLNSSFLDTYAWILYKLEKYNEALHFITLALNYSVEINEDEYEHYIYIMIKLKRKKEAIKFIENSSLNNAAKSKLIKIIKKGK